MNHLREPNAGDKNAKPVEPQAKDGKAEPKGAQESGSAAEGAAKPGQAKPSLKPSPPPKSSAKFDFSFGASRGGASRPPDGGEQNTLLPLILGLVPLAVAYFLMSSSKYKEIYWRDFINDFLAPDKVDSLEVVNNSWVRVHVRNDSVGDLPLHYWFRIGSVETFERNLEKAQQELKIEKQNMLPVAYHSQVET